MFHSKKDMIIGDAKTECSCNLGIKFSARNGSTPVIQGNYWLIRHYNYNSRPIYYNYDNNLRKDLHLYFGTINVHGKGKGWIVDHDFGWMNESPPILFHEVTEVSMCPENVGENWQTKSRKYLPEVKADCL